MAAAKKPTGYVATWGKNAQKNDFDYISDAVLYFRHIGIEHGEWNLITCLFAHKAKDIDPVLMEHMTSYFKCSEQNIKRLMYSLRDQGYIVMSKKKVIDQFIWTIDCSPILERVAEFIKELRNQEKEENTKLSFPAFAKVQQIELAI